MQRDFRYFSTQAGFDGTGNMSGVEPIAAVICALCTRR